jgi:thioesterase domain-containing protein
LLAYELARLLRSRGHEVALLALVDTPLPTVWVRRMTVWGKLRWELEQGPRSATKKVTGMVARHSRSALSRLGVMAPGEPGWFDSDGSKALGLRYRPQGHDAPLVVFAASESLERFGGTALGWEEVHEGDVEVVKLSGDHFTIVSGPEVGELARALSDRVSPSAAGTSGRESETSVTTARRGDPASR